jgi:cysteinyl-tRNA synthetase
MTVRFFFLQANYKSTVDFSNDALQGAEKGFIKLMNAVETLSKLTPSETSSIDINTLIANCNDSMNDDFNTPMTIAHLFDGVKMINSVNDGKATISLSDLEKLQQHYNTFVFEILGLVTPNTASSNDELPSELMNIIIELRKKSKENKDWGTADLIRDELSKLNISIKDSKDSSTWSHETGNA